MSHRALVDGVSYILPSSAPWGGKVMQRYRFDAASMTFMEQSRIPFAVYQFIDRRVVTIALSAGFVDLFEFDDIEKARFEMDNDMYRCIHPDDEARVADAAYVFATEGREYNMVYRTRTAKSSDYIVIHALGEHIYTDEGTRLAVIWYTNEGAYSPEGKEGGDWVSDHSRLLANASVAQRNCYDSLTGLPNMSYFFELADAGVRALLAQGKQPAVLFLDMCGMKGYNSRHGFAEGDKLIIRVAKVLARFFSNENCSRFGQDHYAVYTDADGIEEKLAHVFEACRALDTLPLRAGIYLYRSGDVEIGKACDRAKMACDINRNAYLFGFNYFSEAMLQDTERRQYIIDNLDRAIAEGWIHVYYQPIIRASNGRVCDEEALARWIDPEKGFMSPGEFIPALEEAKLIYRLDLHVLERVLDKMRNQAASGLYVVPQSVNLSRTDFDACDIVEEVRKRVDAAGIGRDKISVEITESTLGSDFEFMKAQIRRFRALGFQVWMDDFGSGYSSLDVLQSAQFDLIKLDMRFMQQFDNGEKSRIILTELVKMALALGIDTVAEGVERKEQADFLREVGCTKLQGYYYCKPIPPEEILERNRKGIQIGFENPEESEYFATIGRINLYDLSIVSSEGASTFHRYFDTLPIAILESDDSGIMIVRCSQSYRDFMKREFGAMHTGRKVDFSVMEKGRTAAFGRALRQCIHSGGQAFIEEKIGYGESIHAFARRVAVNPVTGIVATVVVVLGITDSSASGVTYTHIAQALSADYVNLYYVNLDSERFIEYRSDVARENLDVERRADDFFNASRRDALQLIHQDDRERFIRAFTKENVVRALDENGSFTLTYRLLIDGTPTYVNMKAVRMSNAGNYIIIGINNVDAQMKQQEALQRLKEEQITYARVNALSGDYICIYTVDPETEHYVEYSATRDYDGLGLAKEGERFFDRARAESARTVCPEDLDLFQTSFTRQNVLEGIRKNGLYVLNYRLMMDATPRYICLKATIMEEKDGPRLIVGINNIDSQVRREQEYAHNLAVARTQANIDELTGVKNRRAFSDIEQNLDALIGHNRALHFAIVAFEIASDASADPQAVKGRLKAGCHEICDVFKRSPVFRLDENSFAIVTRGHDFEHLAALTEQLERISEASGLGICWGAARYNGEDSVAAVLARARRDMDARRR